MIPGMNTSALHHIPGRTKKLPPLRVGVGGPVGSGKTTLVEMLCKTMRERWDLEEQARGLVQTVSMFKLAEGAGRSSLPAPVLRDATPRQLPGASRATSRPAGRKVLPPNITDSTEQWEEF